MTLLISWLSAESLRLLALSLLHFLWQGVVLAALSYVAMAACRSAAARYAVGVSTLALMMAAPIGTFLFIRSQEQPSLPSSSPTAATETFSPATARVPVVSKNVTNRPATESAPPYFNWLVEFWFAGVVLLSLRSAGGILLVERLRRREILPVTDELMEICVELQRRMGLSRAVRYCESLHLDAPAVAGWFRPVVLLPVSALTGLTEAQLEAVIAHELAHIRRYDVFVNLFQVGVETLLFYHPAVWWVGKQVRIEREHCCDDAAVAVCGSAVTYAHALTRMAEGKAAPQLAMASNRSPLVERIARLLGANSTAESFRGANLSAGVLCLSAALLAGSGLVGSVHYVKAQTPVPARAAAPTMAASSLSSSDAEPAQQAYLGHVPQEPEAEATKSKVPSPRHVTVVVSAKPSPAPVAVPKLKIAVSVHPTPAIKAWAKAYMNSYDFRGWAASVTAHAEPDFAKDMSAAWGVQTEAENAKQSYIDSLAAAGLTNLSADELIGLKVQGITADYIRSMKDYVKSENGKLDVDELIGMKVQGITGEYAKGMVAATGHNLDADELIGMKVQGVTPEYVKQMHDLGLKTDPDEIIGMKVQGVTPEYIKQMHDLGLKTDADDIIGMKVQGVTPEYVREMRGLGLQADSGEIIGLKVQGVTPEYVKGFNDVGFHPTTDELIGMKVQGVTPGYLKALQTAGFKVDVDDAIGAKVQGITPEFIEKVRSHGFKDLTLDKLIALKRSGVFDAEK